MAGTITKGTTFTLSQQNVTVAQFNPLLTSATLAGIDRDNVKISSVTAATRAPVSPSNPQTNELWKDNLNGFVLAYVGGEWTPALSFGVGYTLDSTSAAVSAGHMLMPSQVVGAPVGTLFLANTTPSVTAPTSWLAVACTALSPGDAGFCILHGPCKVKSTGAIAAGEAVKPSSTDGVVEAAGVGGHRAIGVALSAASGGFVWIHLRR